VLLVPGWTITTRFWQRQIVDLARDHRVVTFDLRGAGNSGKTPDRHSLAAYADDLRHVLATLGLQDVTLVGWAMAVSVAVHLLADGCDRVGRFVWVDHSPRFFATPDWQLGLFGDLQPSAFDAILADLRHDRLAVTRSLLAETMFATPLSDDELEWMTAELFKTPTEVAVAMLSAVAYTDLRPLLPSLRRACRHCYRCSSASPNCTHFPSGKPDRWPHRAYTGPGSLRHPGSVHKSHSRIRCW